MIGANENARGGQWRPISGVSGSTLEWESIVFWGMPPVAIVINTAQ